MEEPFSFIPKPIPKKGGVYKGKDIEDWEWKEFQNYFDDKYMQMFDSPAPFFKAAHSKSMIDAAIKRRGKELLKEMIDWAFDNYYKYSVKWDSFSLTLICPVHGWSNMIAAEAEKIIKNRL